MTDRRSFLTVAGFAAVAAGTGLSVSGCSSSASTPGAAPAELALPVADVPVGGGFIFKEADYVVTQPEAGTFRAFDKTCPHQGCPVTAITDGEIVCRCHNTHFSITDGSVIKGPSLKGLAEATATVSGERVIVTR